MMDHKICFMEKCSKLFQNYLCYPLSGDGRVVLGKLQVPGRPTNLD